MVIAVFVVIATMMVTVIITMITMITMVTRMTIFISGLIISLCLPLRSATELQGVTCLDMSLTEIAKDIIDLHHGHNSYAFISDSRDHTVLHPLMPNPINYGTSLYLNIKELERDPGVPEILEKMKRSCWFIAIISIFSK